MASFTSRFPGQHCVACGVEFIPGESEIVVHPTARGPRGGKKYAHANPRECGARHNPMSHLVGSRKRKSKYSESYVAGYDAAKRLLDFHPAEVLAGLSLAQAWGAAQRDKLVPYWAAEDPEFYGGFVDALPAVKKEARSMARGFESSDTMSRYNPRPRVFRNAGRRTYKGQPKAGRRERMGPVTGLPSVGVEASYHDTDARHMTTQQLVDVGASWSKAELTRRGRGSDGIKLAWKK